MSEKWVVNASPIISLSKINRISFLNQLCDELVIPSGVAEEIKQGVENDPAKIWLEKFEKKYVKDVGSINSVIAAWDLGRGEKEVLNWAFKTKNWTPILDDRAARNCASSLKIRVRGTIGVILLAKNYQKIERVSPLLDQLEQVGFRIDPILIDAALELAGEK